MQKRNTYTEIEEFLTDKSFQLWILSKIDNKGWEEWTLEDLQRAKLVEQARHLLLAMKVTQTDLTSKDIQIALASTWDKIEKKDFFKDRNSVSKKRSLFRYYLTAAAAVLLCLFTVSFFKSNILKNNTVVTYNELIEENKEGLVEQTNNSNIAQIITLSDGSSVLLQPKSKLSYPKIFRHDERKVYLSGEAFFEISKNPKKPFFVYANEIVTRVVGTSFRIKAYQDQKNVEVLVRTGKVRVQSNALVSNLNKEEVVLLPNQALRFIRKELVFNKITNITQDEALVHSIGNIEQLSFEFTDIPIAQIFETIEQAYLVQIDYPKNKLKDCHLTTSLTDQPLSKKLKIICKSISEDTGFEMNGNQITIVTNGCN